MERREALQSMGWIIESELEVENASNLYDLEGLVDALWTKGPGGEYTISPSIRDLGVFWSIVYNHKRDRDESKTTRVEQEYYQVVLVDNDKGTFRPASGNGEESAPYLKYEDAVDDLTTWGLMFNGSQDLSLAVQKVKKVIESELLPESSVPVEEIKNKIYREMKMEES